MGEGFYLIDIVIFAMIAGFLVYRLRGVLGRRHGEERQRPNPFGARPAGQGGSSDNVITLPDRARAADAAAAAEAVPVPLAASLAQIRAADPSFDEKRFLQGATAAYGMIVDAFARGDTATLRPLLSDDVFDNFSEAIRRRQATGETLETRIDEVTGADIIQARLDRRTALVSVKFQSEQVIVTRDSGGHVVEGDPDRAQELSEVWTFARNTRARDPNWVLVETRSVN